ncbi:MAG TPA: WD40 repeat domain-containing protein, partial [Streptosporangiaceae bacterium]|nr:WD40 repeat domain-containing protein [Streptosporangiaceae bacterium]
MTGSAAGILSVTFSPNGRLLASSGDDHLIRLWDTSIGSAIKRICATTGDALTRQQWHAYVPQLPYQPPCPH